jgi:hypothetical protein
MGKWKLLFVNGCEYKGLISVMMEHLNWFQYGRDAAVCLEIMLKYKDNSAE